MATDPDYWGASQTAESLRSELDRCNDSLRETNRRADKLSREVDTLSKRLANAPDPERLYHLAIPVLTFFLAGLTWGEAPPFSVGEVIAGSALLVAFWAIFHRFSKWRAEGSYDLALLLSTFPLMGGLLMGYSLAGHIL